MTGWLTQEPEDRHLERAPLVLVVCQVRHEMEYAASDAARALKIKDALDWPTELAESVLQGLNLAVTQGSGLTASQAPAVRGWQIKSPDGKWTVSLQPDHFAIETTAYSGWDDFLQRFSQLLSAVKQHISPAIEHRIGLRFVNQIQHPDVRSPRDWRHFISDSLFQDNLYSSAGDAFSAAMQVVEMQPSAEHVLVLRHGLQLRADAGFTYVLDNDAARQGSRSFEPGAIVSAAEDLHLYCLRAFEMGTTKDLRDYLT